MGEISGIITERPNRGTGAAALATTTRSEVARHGYHKTVHEPSAAPRGCMKKSHGSSRNYKFGPKNNWRRTIWNEVLKRTAGREQTEPILYLAGPQDLDRKIAVEKGVPTQNMIAIDLSMENVARVRDTKVPVLSGNIHDILRSWPASRPVCAVILDFCSGLTPQGVDVYDLFQRAPLLSSVVAVNFMRGRDSFTNDIRKAVSQPAFVSEDPDDDVTGPSLVHVIGGPETFHLSEKHRALQFLALHAAETWQMFLGNGFAQALATCGIEMTPDAMNQLPEDITAEDVEWIMGNAMMHRVFRAMRPKLYSYRSGVLTFDSAVFQPITRGINSAPPEVQAAFIADIDQRYVPDHHMARKISAMLAVRTTRL